MLFDVLIKATLHPSNQGSTFDSSLTRPELKEEGSDSLPFLDKVVHSDAEAFPYNFKKLKKNLNPGFCTFL